MKKIKIKLIDCETGLEVEHEMSFESFLAAVSPGGILLDHLADMNQQLEKEIERAAGGTIGAGE